MNVDALGIDLNKTMDEIDFLSSPQPISASSSSLNNKSTYSSSTNSFHCPRQQIDSTAIIQQADVSSSGPALLAHDALGPLLVEALDGFFFTVNHNCELDFVSDNVGQYLKFTQEELTGRSLHFCVHPSDVGEFSRAWSKIDAGETLETSINGEQARGQRFNCRLRTNNESTHYVNMLVSVAMHRDSSGSDKTFLVCIARRVPVDQQHQPVSVLGFDQFSSRINLQYEIECIDGSHLKSQQIDLNYYGKNFRDCVHPNDISVIEQHFQEVIEKSEAISPVYRFCLHGDVVAFVSSQSKLFPGSLDENSDSIVSTHTIIRFLENKSELSGNASTRLIKSIIAANRDLQRNKMTSNKSSALNPPIGTQFALTMLGTHKNNSNSLHQHLTNTLGTLASVQTSFSTSNSNPNEKSNSANFFNTNFSSVVSKSSTSDPVTSSETVEFGSKRQLTFSPSLGSVQSNQGSVSSPGNNLETFLPCFSPSNDLSSLLSSPPTAPKKSSSNDVAETNSFFPTQNENFANSISNNQNRSSLRLRQLLSNKSPPPTFPNSPPAIQTPQDPKFNSNSFDESLQLAESPTTTHISPSSSIELSSPTGKRNKTNSNTSHGDALLKQILGRQTPNGLTSNDGNNAENVSSIRNSLQDETKTSVSLEAQTNKLRSDTFLRTLLNDEIRQQKVLVEAPFTYGSRNKVSSQRDSVGSNSIKSNVNGQKNNSKSQITLESNESSTWDKTAGKKKQRQNSQPSGNRTTSNPTRKSSRSTNDETSDYLIFNPQMSFSENSLDSLLDGNSTIESNSVHSSPIVLGQNSVHPSRNNILKRSAEQEDSSQTSRKLPKLLSQALREEIKVESNDSQIISPSIAMAATRPLHSSNRQIVKIEPESFEPNLFPKRSALQSSTNHSQSSLLRSLIRTPQPSLLTTKKDAPLYDLLQTVEPTENLNFPQKNNTPSANSNSRTKNSGMADPLEQILSNSTNNASISTKDEYLAALLSADPQRPICSTPKSTENNRIQEIVNELFETAHPINPTNQQSTSTTTATSSNNNPIPANDDLFYLLDNKDFLECLNDSSTIDSILSDPQPTFPQNPVASTVLKHNENDEKAISEIYQNLVTSFTPGPSSLVSSVDNSPFNTFSGDFLFTENNNNSGPPNRTVTMDSMMNNYRQQQNNGYTYQNVQSQPISNNAPQYSDCLPLDMMDSVNGYPPNVTLNSINNNSYLPSNPNSTMENNSMMVYNQQATNPMQHHQMPNQYYHQSSQSHQQTNAYNNYSTTPPNQVAPSYYSNQQQQQQQQQQISPMSHVPQINKCSPMMHNQRPPQSNNQQIQMHMSMNIPSSNHHPHQQQHQQQQHQQQQHQQQQQQQHQRQMIEPFNDILLPSGNSSGLQQDFHAFNGSQIGSNNTLDIPFNNHDLFMSTSPTGLSMQQNQASPMMHSRTNNLPQTVMHQAKPYPNMNLGLANGIQQASSHSSNNSSMINQNPMECRQSDEVNSQMMNCLSFQPARCTSEFVRKQLQNTIQGRQKPAGGKDLSHGNPGQKLINPSNLDSNQKGAYFRSQLSSSMMTNPSLQPNPLRTPTQHQTHQHHPHH